jgi:hypothetical protein
MVMTRGGIISLLFPRTPGLWIKQRKIVFSFVEIATDKCLNSNEKLWQIWSYVIVNVTMQLEINVWYVRRVFHGTFEVTNH